MNGKNSESWKPRDLKKSKAKSQPTSAAAVGQQNQRKIRNVGMVRGLDVSPKDWRRSFRRSAAARLGFA